MSNWNQQRQATRKNGKYAKMSACPRCGRRKAVEPAYTKDAGGTVRNDSKWANTFICTICIKEES